jgi:hypothetical protein
MHVVTKEKQDQAILQHETEPEKEIFQYKEDTKDILRKRHATPEMRQEMKNIENLKN